MAKKKSSAGWKVTRRSRKTGDRKWVVDRVQTGIRIEKKLLKVLKGLAEYLDITVGDLLESVVLHAFEGKSAFTEPETLRAIKQIKQIYGLELDAGAGHHMVERSPDPAGS